MAVGTNKADRLRAQKVAIKLPDLPERLTQALTARASETRAVAAEWMGRIGDRQYVAALHKAAKAEKYDAALDEISRPSRSWARRSSLISIAKNSG